MFSDLDHYALTRIHGELVSLGEEAAKEPGSVVPFRALIRP